MSNIQPKYDSLGYAQELKEAGVPEALANIQAKALFRVIDQQLVTKQDIKELDAKFGYEIKELEVKLEVKIKELEVKLSHDIQNVQRDIKEVEANLIRDIKEVESKLTRDIKETEAKLTRDIKETEARLTLNMQAMQLEMKAMENRLVIKLGSVVAVVLGLALAAMALLPALQA